MLKTLVTNENSSVAKCGFDFYDYDLKPAIGRDNSSSLLEMTLKQAEPTGPLRVGVYVFSHTLSSLFPFETFSSIQVSHFGRSSTDSLFKRYIEKKHPLKLNFPLFYSLHAKEFRGEECPLGIGFLKIHTTLCNSKIFKDGWPKNVKLDGIIRRWRKN